MPRFFLSFQVAQQPVERFLVLVVLFSFTKVADVSRAVNLGFPALPKIARPPAGVALFHLGRASAPRERFWCTWAL